MSPLPPFLPSLALLLCVSAILGLPHPAYADASPSPRTILVLFEGLTADDLRDPALPRLRALAQRGRVGLMNTAVAGPKTDTAAVLTLALGAQAPAEPTDEEVYLSQSEQVEGAPAGIVYQRRTGRGVESREPGAKREQSRHRAPSAEDLSSRTPERLVHLGIASLQRRGLNERLIGAVIARAGKRGALLVCGNADTDNRPGRRAALFVVDADGIGPYGLISPAPLFRAGRGEGDEGSAARLLARWALAQRASVVVHLGSATGRHPAEIGGAVAEAARPRLGPDEHRDYRNEAPKSLESFLAALTPLSRAGRGEEGAGRTTRSAPIVSSRAGEDATFRLLLVSPRPPPNARGEWDRLTPVVLAGAGVTPGLLTSATTRTPGLLANVDIAPTLLRWLDIPVPTTMTGHPLAFAPAADPLAAIARMDRLVTLNARALVPLFALLGGLAAIVLFGGLAALWRRKEAAPAFAFGLLFLMNMPLAMLLVVPVAPSSLLSLTAWTLGLMLLGAGAQVFRRSGVGGLSAISPLRRVALLTILVIVLDALFGQPLVKFSLFSSYPLQGLRFYGIGNEYMGVLIGLTLLWAFLARLSPLWAGTVFASAAFVLGYPRLGANAGGLVAAVTAFGCGWMILRGRRPTWQTALLWAVGGVAAAFGFAALERALLGGEASHLGSALQSAGTRGYGYLLEIAARKLLMNARILLHPALLATFAGLAAVALLTRGRLRDRVEAVFVQNPDWTRALPAVGCGALAAFLFNDSGVVAAVFLAGAFLLSGLYLLALTRTT